MAKTGRWPRVFCNEGRNASYMAKASRLAARRQRSPALAISAVDIPDLSRGPLRSLLFVPADSERKIAKAFDTLADVVILDLEDAVAPAAKDAAREAASEILRGERRKPVAIRVNAVDTPWHLHDLATAAMMGADLVMLPKCSGAADVARLADQLSALETAANRPVGRIAILPLVTETAAALGTLDYRDVSDRLRALVMAGEDLAADLGVEARDACGFHPLLAAARQNVAIAAAAAGLPAIDTPFPDPRDAARLTTEAENAARLGFAGKLCIHPGQIEAVHDAFRPSAARIAWARAVIGAFTSAPGEGVTLLDGKMIDRAHLRLAERCLAAGAVIPTAGDGAADPNDGNIDRRAG
jgi:citrate lyase subunit beta/citryl-CoA lyase